MPMMLGPIVSTGEPLDYPRARADVPRRRGIQDPDAIGGGAWEAFERVMQRQEYSPGGLAKREAARTLGAHFDPKRSRFRSFHVFWQVVDEAVA